MAQLGRFDYEVQSVTGGAVSGTNVTVCREGATVNGNQSGASPTTFTVRHRGKIATGDAVFVNAATGTTYAATVVSATSITLSGYVGTLSLSSGDRLTPSNSQPTLYSDDQGAVSTGNPLTSSSTGRVNCWMEFGAYDFIVSGGGTTTTAFTSQVAPTEAIGQIRYADEFQYASSTGGIQEAVSDLPTAGGVVVLSGGATYTTSATISLANDVHIRGAGIGATIVKGAAGTTHHIFTASSVSRVSFSGITIDGNETNRTLGHGISLTGTTDIRITDCAFQNIDQSGVRLENSTTARTWISNCYFTNCNVNNGSGDAAIQGHGSPASHSYVWVESNYVAAYKNAGIRFDTMTHGWIRNNRVLGPFGAGDEGIVVGYCTQGEISGNEVSDNNGSGILYGTGTLTTSRAIRIVDNVCYDNNNGIKVEWQVNSALINGLIIRGNACYQSARTQNYGILFSVVGGVTLPTASNAIVSNNVIGGNGTGGIGTSGSAVPLDSILRIHNVPEEAFQQVLAAATDTILARSLRVELVTSGVVSLTMTSAPTIANGWSGQILELINNDPTGADTITLQDQGTLPSSNLRLGAATRVLGVRDTIVLRYDATVGDWVELAFNNVV